MAFLRVLLSLYGGMLHYFDNKASISSIVYKARLTKLSFFKTPTFGPFF